MPMMEELARNHYGAILADPPWHFDVWSDKGKDRSAEKHYDTMTSREIGKLPVDELAAKDCVLFLWTGWPYLPQAMRLIEDWGFTYKTCAFNWLKADPRQIEMFGDEMRVSVGLGFWTRANTEPCLLATKGKPKRIAKDVLQPIIQPRREHSRKPDGVHERIERLVAGPYLELFARQRRAGWDSWGNEIDKFAAGAAE